MECQLRVDMMMTARVLTARNALGVIATYVCGDVWGERELYRVTVNVKCVAQCGAR